MPISNYKIDAAVGPPARRPMLLTLEVEMNPVRAKPMITLSIVLSMTCALCSVGCQSKERSNTATTQSSEGAGRDQQADHMAADDTSRAEQILDEQKNGSRRGAKPAVGSQRDGTRVVDQPRVGRP